MNILVLDGNQNQAVACVRSLAAAGHTVKVGDSTRWSKAGWSRWCRESFRYPAPQENADAFAGLLAERVRREPGTLILPMTEATTLPLSVHRDTLVAAGARLVLPAHADLLRAFDKQQSTDLARSLGVAVPRTEMVFSSEDAARLAQSVAYPVVLKPRSSEEISSTGAVKTGGRPRYARHSGEFLRAYDAISRNFSAVLVQEFVQGNGTGYFALMNQGELRAEFAHQRIRDVHPTGSGSAVRISVPPDPLVREASLAILRALNWHGVAMVEFRQVAGQVPVFMEVNGRFWNSLPLACYAGMDFPRWVARMAEQGDVPVTTEYRVGVRCRWLLGDLRHLVEVWLGPPPGYPLPYPDRWSTLLSVLRPVAGTFHDNFQWSDPLPELGDWLHLARTAMNQQRKQEKIHAQGRYSHP
jgi:predicted ATP-grasp superfamily ATP-dependent carboligase